MPVDMRKLTIIALVAIILIALAIGVYVFIQGGGAAPEQSDDAHFTVTGISGTQYFKGETVIVRAVVISDGPKKNATVSNSTTVAAAGNNKNTSKTGAASPTIVAQPAGSSDKQTVFAELKGDQGFSQVRIKDVILANNVSTAIVFDFGKVPVGSYVVTVLVPGYNVSRNSASVAVKPAPLINEWTSIGDVDFLLDNLAHDHVDVNIRNNGQHTVLFGDRQYNIFLNCSDSYGVVLQGLNETIVWPDMTVTVHANITIAGSYYLDYFSVAVPGRAGLVKFPWGVRMAATV